MNITPIRLALGALLAGAALTPATAMAGGPTCVYNASANPATVTISDSSGDQALRVVLIHDVDDIIATGTGTGGILTACSGQGKLATVKNTERIIINAQATSGEDSIILDQSKGAFAPGLIPETDGASELEVTIHSTPSATPGNLTLIGTPAGDAIRIGELKPGTPPDGTLGSISTAGTDADRDITWTGQPQNITVNGLAGNDLISGRGMFSGTVGPTTSRLVLNGGDGDDAVVDGLAAGDRIRGDAGNDVLNSSDGHTDGVSGGLGFDSATMDFIDSFATGPQADIEQASVSQVGVLRLAPNVIEGRDGDTTRVTLSWTTPKAWRDLRNVKLRVLSDGKSVGTVAVSPVTQRLTGSGAVKLLAGDSRVTHRGKTVIASLALRVPRSLAGKDLRLAVQATDKHGDTQVEPDAGAIRVAA